ncbi:hypothetical protein D3C80_1527780 [compost metagenome]
MLANILALTLQTTQFGNQLGGVHKAQVHPLPCQRMHGMRCITYQRQPVRGKAAGVTPGQGEGLTFTFHRASAEAQVKSHRQLTVKLLRLQLLQPFCLLWRHRPDDRA